MVATKEGHDTIKEKLQPVRQNLITQMPMINTAEQFLKARLAVKDYGLQRLKHEMGVPPHHDIRTSPLVGTQASPARRPETELCPILTSLSHNVFAMAGAGLLGPGNADDNAALERAGKDYAKRFRVQRNRPENDENWNKGGKWVGVASMSARHRSNECVSNTRGPNVSWSGRS
jgi:hypothetical protein